MLVAHLQRDDLPAPLEWRKGRAVTDRIVYEVAAAPKILALFHPMLGDNIVLWGASVITRRPSSDHGWHCDVESAAPDGRYLSIWIGLRNTDARSSLAFVAGSHRFGKPIQQALAERGGGPRTDDHVLELARAIDPAARIVRHDVVDGQGILFDGRVWHNGYNQSETETRIALLLQYAAAEMTLRMPTSEGYGWPFKYTAAGRMPAILVSGSVGGTVNRLVPPPPPLQSKEAPMITTRASTVELPLAEDPVKRWRTYPQFRGSTRTFESMSCHISVLSPGHQPHPPHVHSEEELLIVLEGEVEIVLAAHPEDASPQRVRMRPGMFSYYPSTQHHTICNPGASAVTYLMFKWHAGDSGSSDPLPTSTFTYGDKPVPKGAPAFFTQLIFEQATHRLGKLHAHFTTIQPGGGYAEHVDAHDVAILVLSGEVETVGARVKPFGVVYYSAGELHGMRNVGTVPATYLVFEFHSPAAIALKIEAKRQAHLRREARALAKSEKRRGLRGFIRRIRKALKRLR